MTKRAALPTKEDVGTEDGLPPNWIPDSTLKAELPPHLDYRHYRRITQAPARYVVNIMNGEPAVWDLKHGRALKADCSKHRLRPRYELDRGPLKGGRQRLYLSRMVCEAVFGPPSMKILEAHHTHLEDGNGWWNLSWQWPEKNRAIERIRPEQRNKQRSGSKNSNAKETVSASSVRSMLVNRYRNSWSVKDIARQHNISTSQARRILSGESRREEVMEALKGLSFPRHRLPPHLQP